jgi:hypothetical protein
MMWATTCFKLLNSIRTIFKEKKPNIRLMPQKSWTSIRNNNNSKMRKISKINSRKHNSPNLPNKNKEIRIKNVEENLIEKQIKTFLALRIRVRKSKAQLLTKKLPNPLFTLTNPSNHNKIIFKNKCSQNKIYSRQSKRSNMNQIISQMAII